MRRMDGRAADVLVCGDINVDVMAPLPGPLEPGGDNLPPAMRLELGGVGANVAVALAKWGARVRLAGAVGRDAFGAAALEALERQGVDTQAVARRDDPTGLIVIPVEPGGRRTIIGTRGANQHAPQRLPEECLAGVRMAHCVGYSFLAGEMGAWVEKQMQLARQRGVPVVLDVGLEPSRTIRDRILAIAPLVETLLVSLEEGELLTRKTGAEALEALATCGAQEVIVKRGAGGCQFLQGGRWWAVPAVEVEAVDTTGAGDAFAAGYIAGRLRGWATADSVELANACGAAAATVSGAGEQMPGPADVLRVLEQQPPGGRETSAAKRVLRLLREPVASVPAK